MRDFDAAVKRYDRDPSVRSYTMRDGVTGHTLKGND